MKPRIDRTEFGSVTIDGEIHEHDVIIRLDGQEPVAQRRRRQARRDGPLTVT
jgi:hypothetical protein